MGIDATVSLGSPVDEDAGFGAAFGMSFGA